MRRILPVACVAFTFAVGLSAQTTGTSTQTQGSTTHKTHSSSGAKSSGRAVTVTGCLREGDTPGTYQLTNVDMSSMGAKSGKGTKTHSGTATSGGSTSGTESSSQSSMGSSGTVNLVAGGSVNLKEHVGHRVQVTGSWAAGQSGTAGTSGSGAEDRPGQTGSETSKTQHGSMSGNDMSGRQLTVKSLKHISDTCQ